MTTTLKLYRFYENENSTLGRLEANNQHFCFTIEDEHRDEKANGKTRIPMGRYRLRFRREATPLTVQYRKKYDWFSWHIELLDVPNFTNIYIHIGNFEHNTDGCILVNDGVRPLIPSKNAEGSASLQAFERLYKYLAPLLDDDTPVYTEIHNK